MEYKDYYAILGVNSNASTEEIREAYRKLVKKYHPDLHPDDDEAEKKMKEINEAYHVLIDPEKRRRYDQLGQEWNQHGADDIYQRYARQGNKGGTRYYTYTSTGDSFGKDFSDFFRMFFGEDPGDFEPFTKSRGRDPFGRRVYDNTVKDFGGQPNRQQTGRQEFEKELHITLEEAYFGATKTLALRTPGNGHQGPAPEKKINVKVPPGTRNGSRLRMRKAVDGQGDLLLKIVIQDHPFFRLDNGNLRCRIPITLSEAVLGAKVQVPTMKGTATINIPAGTNPGRTMRLKGLGMPASRNHQKAGDQLCEIELVLPQNLDEKEKDFFRELRRKEKNPREKMWKTSST